MVHRPLVLAGLAAVGLTAPALGAASDPFGAMIAFTHSRTEHGRPDIYLMRADGTGLRRVTRTGGSEPAWSPDARRIAFVRLRPSRRSFGASLWSIGARGAAERRLAFSETEDYWEPTWSPDGRRIAFEAWTSRGSAIAVISTRGGRRRLLTNARLDDHMPAWSPDGRSIAFVRGANERADIHVMRADGTGARRVRRLRGEDLDPAWSPDGRRLAFTNRGRRHNVYVMRTDGRQLRRISVGGQPSWSPTGKRIVYATSRDGDPEIHVIGIDRRGDRKLTSNRTTDTAPAWASR